MTHVRNIMSALSARWWLILLAALAAGGATALVGLATQRNAEEATVRVGLTSASEWPNYQADLESFGNIVVRPETIDLVRDELGDETISADLEFVEGLFVVEVVVHAMTESTALDAAQRFAGLGISQQDTAANSTKLQELETLRSELVEVEDSVAVLEAEENAARADATELARANDDEYSFERDSLYREANTKVGQLTSERASTEQRSLTLQNRIDDLELESNLPSERLFIIQDPMHQADPTGFDGYLPIALAAIAGALAAGAWVVAADRLHGPVRSAEQVESVLGCTVLADMTGPDGSAGASRLNQALASVESGDRIALTLTDDVRTSSADLRVALLDRAGQEGSPTRPLASLTASSDAATDPTILVVAKGKTPMSSLKEQLRLAEIGGRTILGLVLAT